MDICKLQQKNVYQMECNFFSCEFHVETRIYMNVSSTQIHFHNCIRSPKYCKIAYDNGKQHIFVFFEKTDVIFVLPNLKLKFLPISNFELLQLYRLSITI